MAVKVSVNLMRKRSRNFDSDCVTVGIEADAQNSLSNPAEFLSEISGLFRLAEQAITEEFANLGQDRDAQIELEPSRSLESSGEPVGTGMMASGKQVSFIRSLARRNKLSDAQLSTHIGAVLGEVVATDRLTKRQAAQVIESLHSAERN